MRAMSAVRARGGRVAGASPASASHQRGAVVRGQERDVERAAAQRAGACGAGDSHVGSVGRRAPASPLGGVGASSANGLSACCRVRACRTPC